VKKHNKNHLKTGNLFKHSKLVSTVGAITSLEATSASTLKATFESAVPADAKIVVKKGTAEIAGTISKDDTNKVVTFTGSGNFTAGTYTMTATLGEASVSKDVEVKDSYVASIEITSKEALTSEDGTTAYVYYDVKNQYGESIRDSETINWTTSPTYTSVDRNTGKITIKQSKDGDRFIYGSSVYVTGVHVKTGTAVNTSIKVGMAQAADSVEFVGFLNKNDLTKPPVEKLPSDFQADTYVLLYRTLDQNGNVLDIDEYSGDGHITFISDNPQLIKSPLDYSKKKYTVNGERYAAIDINPGMWVDRGGEVNITWVANKTGKRGSKNFIIDANAMLKSLVLSTPVGTVADGDKDVKIPYTATDTNGKNVTNYSTIVRSTNTLTLNSSVGTLRIQEENDGTAGIYWDDETEGTGYTDKTAFDNQDRPVSLTTIVLGGESSNMLFNVSDKRRPTTIETVDISGDEGRISGDTIVSGDIRKPAIGDWNGFTFIDQYGKPMVNDDPDIFAHNSPLVKDFFDLGYQGKLGDSSNYYYGIKVETSAPKLDGETNVLGITDGIYGYDKNHKRWDKPLTAFGAKSDVDLEFSFQAEKEDNKEVKTSGNVKYSIARIKANGDVSKMSEWDNVSKVKTETYTIVPIADVHDLKIDGLDNRLQIKTALSEEPNGASSNMSGAAFKEYVKPGEGEDIKVEVVEKYGISWAHTNCFTVSGTVDGKTVNIPGKYISMEENSSFDGFESVWNGFEIEKIKEDVLKWSDLYNINDVVKSRKDAIKELRLSINKGEGNDPEMVKKSVTISDAPSAIAEIKWPESGTPGELNMSKIDEYSDEANKAYKNKKGENEYDDKGNIKIIDANQREAYKAMVFDQYTRELLPTDDIPVECEYTVSNVVENTNALAHRPNSFKTIGNSTGNLKITGAEIGDKYRITATVAGTTLSISKDVTVLADDAAVLYSKKPSGKSDDSDLRKDFLGYDR